MTTLRIGEKEAEEGSDGEKESPETKQVERAKKPHSKTPTRSYDGLEKKRKGERENDGDTFVRLVLLSF